MSPISEDELRARLRGVEQSTARPGFAEHIVTQAHSRRRRQRWVMGVAAAASVAVIGGGALVLSDQFGREAALPATPTPTATRPEVTPTVANTSTPTRTATITPSATPTPSATNSPSTSATAPRSTSSPSSRATSSPSATPTKSRPLPPVTFLHAGVKGDGETTSDWVSTTRVSGPCDSDAWDLAGRHKAVERRAIRGGGGDGGANGEALLVFADANSAVAFMADLRALTRGCVDTTNGVNKGVVEGLPGPWAEGVAISSFPNQDQVGGGPVALAVRSGRAVAMSSSAGPFQRTDRVDPGLVRSALPAVQHLYPQLCRYTQKGC